MHPHGADRQAEASDGSTGPARHPYGTREFAWLGVGCVAMLLPKDPSQKGVRGLWIRFCSPEQSDLIGSQDVQKPVVQGPRGQCLHEITVTRGLLDRGHDPDDVHHTHRLNCRRMRDGQLDEWRQVSRFGAPQTLSAA